jgi:hypothetical protein
MMERGEIAMNVCTSCSWLIVGLVFLTPSLGADFDSLLPTTKQPIVYLIDYTDEYFTNPEYVEQFAGQPPDLLHVGKATPITHLWGPIRLLRGENQYTGGPGHTLDWDNIALITPDALAKRFGTIRHMLRRYHEIGIPEIVPYISYHTLAGDHQKRLGFWSFYDRWDAYARWVGTRPTCDPFDWLVVDARGQFVGGSSGGYSPDYYAPLHRYRACINHPDWSRWHQQLIRMVAEVGYDGCFVDNCHPDSCYCQHCKAAFREFLAENRDLHWVRRLTAGLQVDQLELDTANVPAELVRRARLIRTRDHLGMLRETGRRVNPRFTVFPNGNSTAECQLTGSKCDRLMFESTYSPGIMATRATAEVEETVIEVTDGSAPPAPVVHRYDLSNPNKWIEMEADMNIPLRARVGHPVLLEARVTVLGASQRDNDYAEDFHLLLREVVTGEEIRVSLQPPMVLGAPGPSGAGKRPPVALRATWTPQRPGRYLPYFGCAYTDSGHIRSHPHVVRLDRGRICRTHIGTLKFAQHMRARSIFLGYETRRSGWENAAELGLAEMAAFGGGGGYASRGVPQAKYRKFFKGHSKLFEGWRPTASEAILFAYWGDNPLAHVRPVTQSTIHDYLAGAQRPFVALLDATLPTDADRLQDFRVIYLQARHYEFTPAQLDALANYVERGGWLVAQDETIMCSGRPISQLFDVKTNHRVVERGKGRVMLWDAATPSAPAPPIISAKGIQKHLRFALYEKDDQRALHVVNYNVCLLEEKRPVLDVHNVEIRMPVPEGWTDAAALCFDPDAQPQRLDCAVKQGCARFSLPSVHIYKIVLLSKDL